MKTVFSPLPLAAAITAVAALVPSVAQARPHGTGTSHMVFGSSPLLPEGIHYRNGRYFQDMCDHCMSMRLLDKDYVPGGPVKFQVTAAPSGMSPTDITTTYSIPSSSSAGGKIVAIVDSPDSGAYSDLTAYRAGFNLPALPQCSGLPTGTTPCFAQVDSTGALNTAGTPDGGQDGDGETSLDMDMISAACPDCSILLVGVSALNSDPTGSDLVGAVATAIRLGAVAVSMSFGGVEYTDTGRSLQCASWSDTSGDPTGFTTSGHLVMAAAGDWGYNNQDCGGTTPSWPSTAPDLLAIGGTTLSAPTGGGSYSEAAWNDGSGGQDATTSGCSTEFPQPTWQTSLLSGASCTKRATADLSAAAAFNDSTGQAAAIAMYTGGQWTAAEGTSASSPMVAAIFTRIGLTSQISANLGFVYSNASKFNDVTTGSDVETGKTCTSILCKAGTGWDGPTGLGSPNATELATLAAPACTSNTGCSGSTPVCLTPPGKCVQCASNTDCSGATPTCDTTTNTCQACAGAADCTAPLQCATGSDPNAGKCVACTTNAQCSGNTPQCTNDACVACTSSTCSGTTPICTSTGACAECGTNSDCPSSSPSCNNGTCGPAGSGGSGGSGGTGGSGGSGGSGGHAGSGGTGGSGGSAGTGGSGGTGGSNDESNTDLGGVGSSGCAVTENGSSPSGVGLAFVVGLAALAGIKRSKRR